MADTYHDFDEGEINAAIEAARSHFADHHDSALGAVSHNAVGHMALAAQCISVTVQNGKVCLNLPLGLGSVCLPIPAKFPSGTAAQACLDICTTLGFPTGVKVTVSIAGVAVVSQSFGKC